MANKIRSCTHKRHPKIGVPFVCAPGPATSIYLEKAFNGMRPVGRLPIARELGESSLMFLVHPTLSEADMFDTCAAVAKVFAAAAQ